MSFITEVICKYIFTDVHMRNKYRPNRAKDVLKLVKYFYIQLIALNTNLNYNTKVSLKIQHYYFLKCILKSTILVFICMLTCMAFSKGSF